MSTKMIKYRGFSFIYVDIRQKMLTTYTCSTTKKKKKTITES